MALSWRNLMIVGAVLAVLGLIQPAVADPTAEGANKTRITTGTPGQAGKFKVKVKWKSDGGTEQSVEAEADILATDSATDKARKIAEAIQAKIVADFPTATDQGARADQSTAGDQPLPEVIVRNKRGFKLVWDPLESTCRHASLSIL